MEGLRRGEVVVREEDTVSDGGGSEESRRRRRPNTSHDNVHKLACQCRVRNVQLPTPVCTEARTFR